MPRFAENDETNASMGSSFACFFAVLIILPVVATCASIDEGDVPEHVKVMPVFFVPSDEKEPSKEQIQKLMEHLRVAQKIYKEMLKNRDTFEIEQKMPLVIKGEGTVASYKTEDKATMTYQPISEIFAKCGWNRFNCPYVLVIIIMNSKDKVPRGGGRPFNPGFNSGGGFVYISSWSLDSNPIFQGTLQHEMGHSFGLVHVSAYGYDQRNNPSIMSYIKNPWNGFRPTKDQGILNPEDLRALEKNKKVFPNFYFDPTTDVPSGYNLARNTSRLHAEGIIPGQKEYQIQTSTESGETNGSSVSNIVHNVIVSKDSKFNPKRMWHSDVSETGWVSVKLTFPVPVTLCKIAVHSQHSGKYHMAHEVRIEAAGQEGQVEVCREPLSSADAYVSFEKHKADVWQFFFRAGPSKQVVIRGLRFFSSPTNEIFCPTYPYMQSGSGDIIHND